MLYQNRDTIVAKYLFVTLASSFIIVGGIGGIAALTAGYFVYSWFTPSEPTTGCEFRECCTEKWTSPNITGLQNTLRNRLFGQHLVTDTVYKVVKGHWNKSPQKALVLSFNGWTGCGKNFVSKIIAQHAFKKGMESKYVHLIIATHDFPHKSELETYKTLLKEWIVGNVTNCTRSIFIFDEMDKMPEGLIDVLKPFLGHHTHVGGIDYRNTIFLFISSNTGAHIINDEALRNWQHGKKGKDITIKQMDQIINLGAFNSKGGFWHTTLIKKHLIDYFVPFLPLERVHVKQCAKVDLEERGIPVTEQLLNQIADELLYFPKDTEVFSTSGCKKVSSKVDLITG